MTTALDTRWTTVLAGFSRGWIETRQNFTEVATAIVHVFPPVLYNVMMFFFSRIHAPGTPFSLATMMLPGFLCMTIVMGGLCGPTGGITADREDGTLLRAKATPNGMRGYLIGKIVTCALTTLLGLVVILVPGLLIVKDLVLDARAWLLLALTFVVGMVSTVPIGVALGSVMKSLQVLLVVFGCMVVICVSVFFPPTMLPTWLQTLVQAFPAYWVGLGTRFAMLPAEITGAEIDKWHAIGMFAVPGAWAVMGLVLAPILLRRMARHQSGSVVAQTRDRIKARGY